jgi:predicted phage terminase large subunit-like protein
VCWAAADDPGVYALAVHGLEPAAHHQAWLERIRQAVETPGGRLILVAPPGHAKSSYVSLVLPAWYLGRHPERAILAVTSSDPMANQFHGSVELTLRQSAAHTAIFPQSRGRPDPARGWANDGLYLRAVPGGVKDPSYRCVGLGARVLGSRCHLLLLDDVADQSTSTSAVEMERVRRYLDLTLLPRLHPDGSAICIATRWSETDVVAHLQAQGWPLLHTPALSPDGQALWPQRFPIDWLEAERRRIGGAQFETVWQGNPIAVGAGIFRSAEWFRALPADLLATVLPKLTRHTFIDLAWSAKQTADSTVACTVGVDPGDPEHRLYVLSWFRQRVDAADLLPALAEHLLAVRPHAVGVEVGAYRQRATAELVRALDRALAGRLACSVGGVPVATDKVTRARVPAAKAEAGLVFCDRHHPLWPIAEAELLGFPNAAHDDCVDALSGAAALALESAALRQRARPQRFAMAV